MSSSVRWYILNYIPAAAVRRESADKVVERFNRLTDSSLDSFAPRFVKMVERDGKIARTESPLLYHYVFVRGTEETVKRLCALQNGFSFILSHSDDYRYLTAGNAAVESFRIIARYYSNTIPCFSTSEVDLEEGDVVEVVKGDFPGLKGRYIPNKRSKSGRLMIRVSQDVAACVYDINVEYLRVLEFAKDGKRVYDQLEAFQQRLLDALKTWREKGEITPREAAPLNLFTLRFGSVKISNPKIDAKMRLFLMGAYRLIGDCEGYDKARNRYERLERDITNPWTKALALYIRGAIEDAPALLDVARALVAANAPARPSKTQLQLQSNLEC